MNKSGINISLKEHSANTNLKLYRLVICTTCSKLNPDFFPLNTTPTTRICYSCKTQFSLDDAKIAAKKKYIK